MGVREIRLQAEYDAIREFKSDVMTWEAPGTTQPPDFYRIIYNLRSLKGFNEQSQPVFVQQNWIIEITMPPNYPWGKPQVRFAGDRIFHPNVYKHGDICIEDNYKKGLGIPLDNLCEHIGQIIAFQKYNVRSPANSDSKLLDWIQKFNQSQLPTDSRDIRRHRIALGQANPAIKSSEPSKRIKFGS
jgi:ubiquitin-protein ligase